MTRRLRGALVARNQLRIRVMAGVVAVTLAALAAFDLTAVTTMRHYLYGQARNEAIAAIPDEGELPALIKQEYVFPGQYDIAWLPAHGKPLMIAVPLSSLHSVPAVTSTSTIARAAGKPASDTVLIAGQMTLLEGADYPSGSVIVGTSLAPVTNTIGQIERIVMIGSAVVLLLIGAGVLMVLRLGLRPIEAMAAQADRITAGDLAGRVTPHNPRSEVGRLGAALNGMLTIVSDDGPGVASDKLPHIFERFYRAGTGASRPGSGLGLAIAAEVAAAHGGTAEAVRYTRTAYA